MSKHHLVEDRPVETDLSWLRGLAKSSATLPTADLSDDAFLTARAPRHAARDDDPADDVVGSGIVPVGRISTRRIDTVIGHLGDAVAGTPSAATGTKKKRGSRFPAGRLRKPVLLGAAATLCVLSLGGTMSGGTTGTGTSAAVSAPVKNVSIIVDGQPRTVSTDSSSVGGALSDAGIRATDHDTLAPGIDSPVADGSTIVLDRGRLLTLTIDGKPRQIWTTAKTVDDALARLGTRTAGLSPAANRSRSIPLTGRVVAATTPSTVRVSFGGKPAVSSTTAAKTVGEFLEQRHVRLGALDTVSPTRSTALADGLVITVDLVAVKSEVKTVTLPQPTGTTVNDPGLAAGTSIVVQKGRPGRQVVTYRVTTVNGKRTAAWEGGRRTAVSAVGTVTHIGTKTSFRYVGDQVFTNDRSFGVNWDGLAFCESTHNPRAVNANPSAGLPTYGMFQFDVPTWESVGGSGNPVDATPEEQLMRAKLLYQSRGLEPWACRDAAH